MLKTLVRYAGLPLIYILPLWVYVVASASGNAPAWAMGVAIVVIPTLIIWEKYLPSRVQWQPNWKLIKVDLQFLALVHMAFVELLGAAIAIFLIGVWGSKAPLAHWWPGDWPFWAQVALVVFIADFIHYCYHRALHELPILWMFHSLHHSVDRLYTINSTRFHPLEVGGEYILKTMPFILMGVDPRVFGFWVVLHLIIAFTQHCNVDFYFGILSKVFLTAEHHRWHHSANVRESNANYATVFCLWDRVFGTYYCPRKRRVGKLGISEMYPEGFWAQLKKPFVRS